MQPRLAHLHCLYCGAERRGDDSACRKCLAEAPSVPCRRCGAQVFAPRDACICGEVCTAWALASPDHVACARCGGTLRWADVEGAGAHVEQCARCLGCFVRTQDFSELVERESAHQDIRLDAFMPPSGARELPRQALLAEARCPHCDAVMERVRFAQKASLVIDVCPTHGVWLDAGELAGILEHVKHAAAGDLVPDATDQADEHYWNQVVAARMVEEQRVEAHIARAEAYEARASQTRNVIAGTMLGGPWLGLFMALRKGPRRP
jgi:Zn-finger nucleic acid-binding protein